MNAKSMKDEYSFRVKVKFVMLSKKRKDKSKAFATPKDIPKDKFDGFVAKYRVSTCKEAEILLCLIYYVISNI